MKAAMPYSDVSSRAVTWQFFTFTMSTGGLAVLLYSIVHRFDGLDTIGTVLFVANLAFFVALCAGISTRFLRHGGTLRRSLTDPSELFFMPTILLTVSTIITGAAQYGMQKTGAWLGTALQVVFWIQLAVCLLQSWCTYLVVFGEKGKLRIAEFTPGWIVPLLPLMLLGTVAASLVPLLKPQDALNVAVGGLIIQGLGFLLTLLEFALYMYRLSIYGLPPPAARPTMFIAVGPPGFTSYALLKLASSTSSFVTDQTLSPPVPNLASTFQVIGTLFALFTWGLALWFFVLALVCNVAAAVKGRLKYSVAWWSFVFPNVGWTLSTNQIGIALGSNAITWIAAIKTVLLVAVWLVLLLRFAFGLLNGSLLSVPKENAKKDGSLQRDDSSINDEQTLQGPDRA